MKIRPSDVVFVALLGWTVAMAGMALRIRSTEAKEAANAPRPPVARSIVDGASYAQTGFTRGPADATDTVVIFADFECPFCRRLAPVLDTIATTLDHTLIVERHYPIAALHPHAIAAANAAECARDFDRTLQVRAILYGERSLVEADAWGTIAQRAGINDTLAFRQCTSSARHRAAIERDIQAADKAAISGTPTIIIGDSLFPGALSFHQISTHLRAHRASKPNGQVTTRSSIASATPLPR